MFVSRHANPNSVAAINARMVAAAGTPRSFYREEPVARDVKGHVDSVGNSLVYFTIRHGEQICLRFKETEIEFRDRLVAARKSGECLEIIYAETNGFIISGDILTIC